MCSAIKARVEPGDPLSTISTGYAHGTPSGLRLINLTAGSISGTPAGSVGTRMYVPAAQSGGQIAFGQSLKVDPSLGLGLANSRLFVGPTPGGAGGVGVVARGGDPAPGFDPGESTVLGFFGGPSLNAHGQGVFETSARRGDPIRGELFLTLYRFGDGSLQRVATTKTPAPGITGQRVDFFDFDDPVINNRGDVAFWAGLDQVLLGLTGINDGVFRQRRGGSVEKVAGQLDEITLPGGVRAVVRGVDRPRLIGEDGAVAYRLRFTDGSSGVFSVRVPEPGAVLVIGLAVAAWVARRPGRRVAELVMP